MADKFYDDEQEEANAESQKQFDQAVKRRRNDIRKILSSPEGRRVIWWLWSLCGTFCSSYTPKDSNHTAFREGERNIGLALLLEINLAKPEAYAQMQREYASEIKSTKAKDDANG